MRKAAEGSDDLRCLVVRERIEDGFKLASGGRGVIAMKGHGRLADALDDLEHLLALLLPDDIPEDAAEQADVLAQGAFVILVEARRDLGHDRPSERRSCPGLSGSAEASAIPPLLMQFSRSR